MIDQADYALLNAVSVVQWQAYLLNGKAGVETIMNMPGHGLGRDDLIEHFWRLWSAGLLQCSLEESGPALVPDSDLLRKQYDYDAGRLPIGPIIFYGLSQTGGDLWENLSSPDWSKFLRSGVGQSESTWVLAGGDRTRVELLRKCSSYFPAPMPGTERCELCEPWRATYWKTVERGYELSFSCDPSSWTGTGREWDREACDELWRTWHTWHKSFDEVCRESAP